MKKDYRIQASKHLAGFQEFTFCGTKKGLLEQVDALLQAGFTEISCVVIEASKA
jgi:hypothetical protein